MRILLLVNNWVGWQVTAWLRQQGDEIVGLVLHPGAKRKFGEEIIAAAGLTADQIIDGSHLGQLAVRQAIGAMQPELALSILFDYILKPEFINLFPQGVVNLHPAYLPYNRGQYPNVWSIVEQTPAGVTLHYIDPGIDTGDIIARQQVPVEPVDTGETLYRKLERASVALFKEMWPLIRAGQAPRLPQDRQAGTYHRSRDVETIDPIDLDQPYTARTLIDILRARTFPPYSGAYFMHNGRKVYLRLELMYEQPAEGE